MVLSDKLQRDCRKVSTEDLKAEIHSSYRWIYPVKRNSAIELKIYIFTF